MGARYEGRTRALPHPAPHTPAAPVGRKEGRKEGTALAPVEEAAVAQALGLLALLSVGVLEVPKVLLAKLHLLLPPSQLIGAKRVQHALKRLRQEGLVGDG